MAFPIIAVLTAIPSIFSAYRSAYKTVKAINADKDHLKIKDHLFDTNQPALSTDAIGKLGKEPLNALKRKVVIDILALAFLDKLEKRGRNRDDLGTIVDMACLIYKLVSWKR
jgi:hypothetical protein